MPLATVWESCSTRMWAALIPAAGALVHQPLAALVHSLPLAIRRPTLLQREVTQLQDLRLWHAEHGRQLRRPLSTCSATVAPAPCEPAQKAQVNLSACFLVTVAFIPSTFPFNFTCSRTCSHRWHTGR